MIPFLNLSYPSSTSGGTDIHTYPRPRTCTSAPSTSHTSAWRVRRQRVTALLARSPLARERSSAAPATTSTRGVREAAPMEAGMEAGMEVPCAIESDIEAGGVSPAGATP